MEEQVIEDLKDGESYVRRKDLLPKWVTIFSGIFLMLGVLALPGLLAGLFGLHYNIGIYGLDSKESVSLIGIGVTLIFLLKGVVSLGLLKEKKWAVDLAIADAVIGIVICCVVIFVVPLMQGVDGFDFEFRIELIPLGMFLLKMLEIRSDWISGASA